MNESITSIGETVESNEKTKDEVFTKIENPIEFLSVFYKSEFYQKEFDDFYRAKNINKQEITHEELVEVFERTDVARRSLVSFSQENTVILKYSPDMYSEKFKSNFRDYLGIIKDITNPHVVNPENVISLDNMRSDYHSNCAQALVEQGITKSNKIARGLVQLMIIEKGFDTFSNAQVDELSRLRKFIGF